MICRSGEQALQEVETSDVFREIGLWQKEHSLFSYSLGKRIECEEQESRQNQASNE